MRIRHLALSVTACAMIGAAPGNAQLQPVQPHTPHPGSAALAAAANVVFVPVRLAVTAVGGLVGGMTGWLTAGNQRAAQDIWNLTDGQGFLQPQMLYGEEPLYIGDMQFRMHVTEP